MNDLLRAQLLGRCLCVFVYLWVSWVCVAAQAFSHCGELGPLSGCGTQASRGGGPSHYGARALSHVGCRDHGTWPQSLWLRALERRLSSCGPQASLLGHMWDLPSSETEPVSPALAGGFFTTEPPGQSLRPTFEIEKKPHKLAMKQ